MKKTLTCLVIALVILTSSRGLAMSSTLDVTVAPYRWNLMVWEGTHVFNKWLGKIGKVLSDRPTYLNRGDPLIEFFRISRDIDKLEGPDSFILHTDDKAGDPDINENLVLLRDRQASLKPEAEELLESLVSSVLTAQGLGSWMGVIWPPVDIELTRVPTVLVLSPRDVIERRRLINLRPDLGLDETETLENKILLDHDMSALAVEVAGIATYPSVVSAYGGLRSGINTTVHEWLHQYWFFSPLGFSYWDDPDTMSLNETAAELAGRELGDIVYRYFTSIPADGKSGKSVDHSHFVADMRDTRMKVDRLLAAGMVEEAEDFMERQRESFVRDGYNIRKLNQAYFAFHGAYGANPASISTINDEVEKFRRTRGNIGDFIRAISEFSNYGEFKANLSQIEDKET